MAAEIIFAFEGVPSKQATELKRVNATLGRLAARRKEKIVIVDQFLRSKLAWKVAIFQQSILYRVVALARGTACLWNDGNFLTSIIAARALLETIVVFEDFGDRLHTLIEAQDIDGIDKLVMNRTFATRDTAWLASHPDSMSVNIMTLIKKLDKTKMSGIQRHYDSLSEKCHPNSPGHHQMFSTLDPTNGTTTYSETKHGKVNLVAILPALSMVRLFEHTMDALDQAVLDLAELQHRSNPIA